MDIAHLQSWIGAARKTTDLITPRLANGLAAVLDDPCDLADGDPAPAGIHWCLAPDIAPMSGLGPDGHPARGGFLPPVPLPRRMWAGGELAFTDNFRVGDRVSRVSRIEDVRVKTGRTGTLCFVTVRHDYATLRGPALSERHDIVYRALEAPAGGTPPEPDLPPVVTESHSVPATATLLVRYSEATLNGHRIHYDRDYCRDVEFYPGLVVHGPLQATFLLRLATRMGGGVPARFSYRGTAPLFDGGSIHVNGAMADSGEAGGAGDPASLTLWIRSDAGSVTMLARTDAQGPAR